MHSAFTHYCRAEHCTLYAAVRTVITAKLMPPTLQPVNANQNDSMLRSQVSFTLLVSRPAACTRSVQKNNNKPQREPDRVVISLCVDPN